MERRADAGSGLDISARESSKTWQAIRRALGRLVSHVGVVNVEDKARTITPQVLPGELALPPPPLSARDWKPAAVVTLAPVPAAGTGLRESDLLPAATLAAGDYALPLPEVFALPIAGAALRTDSAALEWLAGVIRLPDAFVRLPASPVQTQSVSLLPLPKTAVVPHWAVPAPKAFSTHLPRVPAPRVRWAGDSILRRMPVTRRGKVIEGKAIEGKAREDKAAGDAAGRRRLAETVQLRPDEVMLLGVYPDVPILAVERIVVEDEGRQLRLWLKPDILRSRSGTHRITLLVGRQISTGKMLQAAL